MVELLAQQEGGGYFGAPVMIGLFVLLFYLMMIRPEQQKQKEHRARVESLKKNDRVVTVGGIYGVVTNVHRSADEVTLKVDETTGTKIRVTPASIGRVLTSEDEET